MSAVLASQPAHSDSVVLEKACQDFRLEAALAPCAVAMPEQYSLLIKPGFETAAWAFGPPHRIFLGDLALSNAKATLNAIDKGKYLQSFLWHEYAHALYTDRDAKSLQAELDRQRIPFPVFNRFEDIRIEARFRAAWSEFRFDWQSFEKPVELAKCTKSRYQMADAMLFLLTQCEADVARAEDLIPGQVISAQQDLWELACQFYRRACMVDSSRELFPVMRDWLKLFPEAASQEANSGGMQDASLSLQLSSDPQLAQEFAEGCKPASGSDAQPGAVPSSPGQAAPEAAQASKGNARDSGLRTPVDTQELAEAIAALSRLWQPRKVRVTTSVPTRRVSIRHHLQGRGPYRETVDASRRSKRVALVVDCSGSMSGSHISAARSLIAALSHLAKSNAVEGYVILSKVGESGACWERFQLPLAMPTIESIQADGAAEGLAHALEGNRGILAEMDALMVFTDGNITDAPLNKRWLHSLGIFTAGIYVGTRSDAAQALEKYFDRVWVRPNLKVLLQDLVLSL